jgi:phage gpG-like protein
MGVTVKNFQIAKADIERHLRQFMGGKFVTVGVHEDAGMHQSSEPGSEAVPMAQVAALNNYGNPHNTLDGHPAPVPARPFLIPGVESAQQDIKDAVIEAIERGATLDETLNSIGAFAAGGVQQYMTDLKTPPNAAYTIEKKGSSNPLIDTGALRASVTYKVTKDKPEEGI